MKICSKNDSRWACGTLKEFSVRYTGEDETRDHFCDERVWRIELADGQKPMQRAIQAFGPSFVLCAQDCHSPSKKEKSKVQSHTVAKEKRADAVSEFDLIVKTTIEHERKFRLSRAVAPYLNAWLRRAESVCENKHFRNLALKWGITKLLLVPKNHVIDSSAKQLKFDVFGVTCAEEIDEHRSFRIHGLVRPSFLKSKIWNFGKFGVGDVVQTTASNLLQCRAPSQISKYVTNEEEDSAYADILFENLEKQKGMYLFQFHVFVQTYLHKHNNNNNNRYEEIVPRHCGGSLSR